MTNRLRIDLNIGGVEASHRPALLRTLLGSCISVCLWDREARCGGMNHFMLPQGPASGGDPARFGVHAMDLLIGALQRQGGERDRLVAKVFGGASVLSSVLKTNRVPEQNIDFIDRFMKTEGIPVVARDLGGVKGRLVYFLTDTGQAFVKQLGQARKREQLREDRRLIAPAPAARPAYGEVELWT